MTDEMILRVRNVSRYFGSLAAVKDLSFEVKSGEVFGIAGPNGSGKTTLINTITHIIPPNNGEIYFKDKPIHNQRTYNICHFGVARTFQNPEIFGSLSIMDNILLGATYGMKHERGIKKRAHAREILEFVGLKGREEALADSLTISGKKRVMLAIALATRPQLLMLDEPCSGLITIESKDMISLIEQINGQGVTIMIIEHNMKVLMSISHRVMIMNHGVSICEGTPDQVCSNDQVINLYIGKKYSKERTA